MVGGERTGVEETAAIPEDKGHFLPLSLFFDSIFPSLPQTEKMGEKRNASEPQSA